MDLNGDGIISKDEIKTVYEKKGMLTDEEVDRIMRVVDNNDNQEINYSEFLMAASNRRGLLTNERIDACFKIIDRDNSGYISMAEFKELLGK